jgi:RHS repeat-associated protein
MVLPDDFLVFERPDPNKHVYSRIGNNYLFHSREYEPEVGLYYYRNRYYMPRIGRFLQTDPTGYMDSMNLYQAFGMNPVNFTDPMGAVISENTLNHFKTWRNAYNFVRYTYGAYLKEGYAPHKAYKKLINTGLVVDRGTKEDYYFALRLSMEPFWGPFDRSPEQMFIDTVAGFGDAAGEVVSGVSEEALRSSPIISGYEKAYGPINIPNVSRELRGRVQNAMGLGDIDIVDEGSAYYFAGNTLYYSISGGILSAQISTSVYFSHTSKVLPFLDDAATTSGSKVFYTVQSSDDAARLMEGGNPWPTTDTRAALGEGIYAWGSKKDALAYLQRIKSRVPDAKIIKFSIPKHELSKLKNINIDSLANPEVWMSKYSRLWGGTPSHGYQYIIRGTAMGQEHYFHFSIFHLLRFIP